MAKLKARGRYELLRIQKETSTPDGDLTVWERETRAYMSDGAVLTKRDVRFRPDQYDPEGRSHTWGWKVYGKAKPPFTPQGAADHVRQAILDAVAKNGKSSWTIVE